MKKILLLVLFFILSCGARKTENSKQEVKNDFDQTTNKSEIKAVDTDTNLKKEVKKEENDSSTVEKTSYSPIDPTKPAVINEDGKKTELNNSTLVKEKSTYKGNKKSAENTSTSIKSKVNQKNDNNARTKASESVANSSGSTNRKQWTISYWWLILIPIFLFLRWLQKRYNILGKFKLLLRKTGG